MANRLTQDLLTQAGDIFGIDGDLGHARRLCFDGCNVECFSVRVVTRLKSFHGEEGKLCVRHPCSRSESESKSKSSDG